MTVSVLDTDTIAHCHQCSVNVTVAMTKPQLISIGHIPYSQGIPIQNVLSLGKLVQNTFIPTALIIVWGWETCVYMYIIKGYMVVIGLCLVLSDKRMKMTGYSHRG